jgi:anaerobic ribonucleoside-triphosphate reductase activating protein
MIARAGSRRSALCVGGFVPFTATDYPGALAAVVFCQGCPWRCGYCHNPHLLPADGDGERRFDEIVDWLASRRGLLDAVVFSGGEPTAQPALVDAIAAVRERGFKVGLHTAGAYPRRLAQWLSRIDWVGIDIKAPRQDYEAVTGAMRSGEAAWTSLECIVDAGVACEVRTTVHPALTPAAAMEKLACELAALGIVHWVLQPFRAQGCASADLVAAARETPFDGKLLARLTRHIPDIRVRA